MANWLSLHNLAVQNSKRLIPNMWPSLAPEKSVIGLIDKWSPPHGFGRPFEGASVGLDYVQETWDSHLLSS